MKLKPQRPRSCLGWFAWVFAILLMLFAISYNIDMWRLTSAWNEAYTLAVKLGYTPERHLTYKADGNPSLLLISGDCTARLFFTTPLDPSDFDAYLKQVAKIALEGERQNGMNIYTRLPFIVDGRNTLQLTFGQFDTLPRIHELTWYVGDDIGQSRIKVDYSELSQVDIEFEYNNHPITENVAYISVEAGDYPIWTWLSKCSG